MNDKTKIKAKIGSVEIEYEGNPDFLDTKLENLLETLKRISGEIPAPAVPTPSGGGGYGTSKYDLDNTVIASRLEVKTGPDLIIAALTFLEFSQGKKSSSASEIKAAMRNATGYVKDSMITHFAEYMLTLMKKKEVHKNLSGDYSLPPEKKKGIEAKISTTG